MLHQYTVANSFCFGEKTVVDFRVPDEDADERSFTAPPKPVKNESECRQKVAADQ